MDGYDVALLHMDGTDTSTTFTDESGKTWAALANAQIDTAQSKFGEASGLFDGTGDGVTGDGSAPFAFGTGDFTIDFWTRIAAINVQYIFVDLRPASTNGLYPTIYKDATNVLYFYTNSANRITGTTALATGPFYHIALTRSGISTKLFLNGTQEGFTYTDSNDYLCGASRPMLGRGGDSDTNGLNGWLDEVRISKGIARWTATFPPPTSAYGTGGWWSAF